MSTLTFENSCLKPIACLRSGRVPQPPSRPCKNPNHATTAHWRGYEQRNAGGRRIGHSLYLSRVPANFSSRLEKLTGALELVQLYLHRAGDVQGKITRDRIMRVRNWRFEVQSGRGNTNRPTKECKILHPLL